MPAANDKRALSDIITIEGRTIHDIADVNERQQIMDLVQALDPLKAQILSEREAAITILKSGYIIVNGFKDLRAVQRVRKVLKERMPEG
ncbi:hypothetical protein FRZ67_18660 [Panacibacter ginsenosidivorans]|uniref:Uncharacterized protein n=1 Tax=Panacibacter ginsenosidivorans TaxID=1813871 RepID=A0A5B8VCQ4_9BACT|nr:hypothetical protein [Panacibacter ginsenosidivorans]QEC69234.1 hypothetical protein FRZ67_18660 [Panacibacter ginsenosidivorans]